MADTDKDTFIERVSKMADELGLTGDDRNDYIHRHAKAKGYRMVPTWVKESEEGDGGSGFFGKRSSSGDGAGEGKKRGSGWFPE